MSRACYSDGDDNPDYPLALWRGAVQSAIRGKRGQSFLREMLAALDALPNKRLIAHTLDLGSGQVCALGSVALKRGLDVSELDPSDWEKLSGIFGISEALIREIEYENDEGGPENAEQRWVRVRNWVEREIIGEPK